MDLFKAIRELREEKARLDSVINMLESMVAESKKPSPPPALVRRRGRKNMGEAERQAVSERMRQYWADRRAARESGSPTS